MAAPCFSYSCDSPQGRAATQAYLAKIGNGKWEQFPEGTQFALVRRMLLIDASANICVSPLTEEVQLRAFRHLDTVDSYSLLLSRKDLFAGRRGGLRVVEEGETPATTSADSLAEARLARMICWKSSRERRDTWSWIAVSLAIVFRRRGNSVRGECVCQRPQVPRSAVGD